MDQVHEIGMLVVKPTLVRTLPVLLNTNIAAIAEQLTTSNRHRSQQLDIPRISLMRILHKDLAMKPIDHPIRLPFAN